MTDWKAAGHLADAHRVQNLYRKSFSSDAKSIARGRVTSALRSAGVSVVLDLWGGGSSAEDLVGLGFRVIAVENGSMRIEDKGRPVSNARKRRALAVAGTEGGYQTFWGSPQDALAAFPEIDGAYLDFCGPWTPSTRSAVIASRSLRCIAVTLAPDHDTSTGASNAHERQMAYQLFLKMAWADRPRWESMTAGGHVRRLLDYRRPTGISVFLYLLSHESVSIPSLTLAERHSTRPDKRKEHQAKKREWYHRPENHDRIIAKATARYQERRIRSRECAECGLSFGVLYAQKRYCSEVCAKKAKADQQRTRVAAKRLSGVSGTPDEAVQD